MINAESYLHFVLYSVLEFFSSDYILVLATAGLVGIGIGIYFNRSSQGIVRKLIGWGAALIVLACLSGIARLFVNVNTYFQGIFSREGGASYMQKRDTLFNFIRIYLPSVCSFFSGL